MQQGFFNQPERIELDASHSTKVMVDYFPDAFAQQQRQWYQQLLTDLAWQQDSITIAGVTSLVPRLQAYIAAPELAYSYSGIDLSPKPWNTLLLAIKSEVEQLSGEQFNAVLCNYYRDGNDSVGWHSDDETELGAEPIIASVSLGGTRQFQLRSKLTRQTHSIDLHSGSLLVMGEGVQRYYEHCVGKEKAAQPRINLTFRRVIIG